MNGTRFFRIAAGAALAVTSLAGPMASVASAQETELKQCLRGCNEAYWDNPTLHNECVARCSEDYG
jgi:hypothetical protein